jgi:hypothetical protein
MIYVFKNLLSLRSVQLFSRNYHELSKAISNVRFHDNLSWEGNKNVLQNMIYQSQHSVNFPGCLVEGKTAALDSIWDALFSVNSDPNWSMILSYKLIPQCHKAEEVSTASRNLSVVYLDNIELDSNSFDSLQHIMDIKLNNRTLLQKRCQVCHLDHTVVRPVLIHSPECLFLTINLDLITLRSEVVDNSIVVFGIEYELCVVFYVHLAHFMSRFVYHNGHTDCVLEYDGVKNCIEGAAQCSEVKTDPKFPCMIESSGFKMSSVVYMKKQ